MTAAVIIGVLALILFSVTAVVALHIVRQSASDAFRALEQRDVRSQRQVDDLLLRLMTIRWEDYAAVKAIEDDEEEGGFIPPGHHDEEEGEMVVEDGKWGHLSTLRERLRVSSEEQELLNEDFDDKGNPRRSSEL